MDNHDDEAVKNNGSDEAVASTTEQRDETTSQDDSPSTEGKTPENEGNETEGSPEAKSQDDSGKEDDDNRTSPRLQNRVRDLSRKVREAREQNQGQHQQGQYDQGQHQGFQTQAQQNFAQQNGIQPGDYTPEQLQQMVNQQADILSNAKSNVAVNQLRQEMEQDRLLNGLEKTVNSLQGEYEELNPKSSNYNKELDTALGETIEESFISNPYVDVEKLAKRIVDSARSYGTAHAKQVGQKVAEQSASSAVNNDLPSKRGGPNFTDPNKFAGLSRKAQAQELAEMEKQIGLSE